MRISTHATAAASLAALLTLAGTSTTSASAGTVTRNPYDSGPVTSTDTTLCSFPVEITGRQTGYLTDQALPSGGDKLSFHGTETDVFSANGKTLTGLPYTVNLFLTSDADGNMVRFFAAGIAERVPLPQGGEFFAAGFTNWMLHLDVQNLLNPDHGRMDNLDKLCAALS